MYGCILGLLFLRESEKKFQKDNTFIEIVGVILTLTQIFIYTKYNVPLIIKYSLYWAPLSMMLVWLAVHENGAISKILCKKVMVYIGDMSAVYFLIHQAIIKFTEYIIPNDKILLSLASLAIVMFTAFIYIEIVKAVQRIKYVRR